MKKVCYNKSVKRKEKNTFIDRLMERERETKMRREKKFNQFFTVLMVQKARAKKECFTCQTLEDAKKKAKREMKTEFDYSIIFQHDFKKDFNIVTIVDEIPNDRKAAMR